jgi:uncharacterized membrane protein SpoIIM required for sporulation
MKQHQFQAAHAAEWQALGAWLDANAPGAPKGSAPPALEDADFPAAYRRLCQHYALAQRRGYSASLLERLRELVHRGHAQLYRAPRPRWRRSLEFIATGFPQAVHQSRAQFLLAFLLLFGPLLATIALLQWRPELVYTIFDAQELAKIEAMYDPAQAGERLGRESGTDVTMFGHYVLNNVSIGFRTFASGLLGALGPVFFLVLNGVMIGAVAGHLTGIGYGEPFWRFVVGHSAPELLAIVISGAAGLRLGMALLAPGRRSRGRALVEEGMLGARLALGVFAMLVFAAFIEAFWSSIGWLPDTVKFGSGGLLWLAIGLWLWRGARAAQPE